MLSFILALCIVLGQESKVQFELVNSSKDTIKLELPGFSSLLLSPGQSSVVRFQKGQEVLYVKEVNGGQQVEHILLFVVNETHQGQSIRIDKLLKKAEKTY